MDNLFGLDTTGTIAEEPEDLYDGLTRMGREQDDWMANAKDIAKMDFLPVEARIAAMFLGVEQLLSQIVLLQGPILYNKPIEDALEQFQVYIEFLGTSKWDGAYWMTLFVFLGAYTYTGTGALEEDLEELEPTAIGRAMAEQSETFLDNFIGGLRPVKAELEKAGIEFPPYIGEVKS